MTNWIDAKNQTLIQLQTQSCADKCIYYQTYNNCPFYSHCSTGPISVSKEDLGFHEFNTNLSSNEMFFFEYYINLHHIILYKKVSPENPTQFIAHFLNVYKSKKGRCVYFTGGPLYLNTLHQRKDCVIEDHNSAQDPGLSFKEAENNFVSKLKRNDFEKSDTDISEFLNGTFI